MSDQITTFVILGLGLIAALGAVFAVLGGPPVPNAAARRLRAEIRGQPGSAAAPRQGAARTLQSKPSEWLDRFVALFRVSERLTDGPMVRRLQQAGYRGRAAAVKYLALRIASPACLALLSAAYAWFSLAEGKMGVGVLIVCGGTAFGWILPGLLLKNRIDRRKIAIGRAWPDAVDLLLICVQTGMSIEHAFRKVAEEMASTSIELAQEMRLTTAELAYQQDRRLAYENLARRADLEAVRAVTGCLIQSEKYGTPLSDSLRILAQETRAMRIAAAERKAAALPPKLTVPMILFFLPVLFAVIVTPAVLQYLNR